MEPAEAKALDLVVLRLHRRFPDRDIEEVRGEVIRAHRRYDASRIRGFLPILVEREVAESFEHGSVAS